MAFTLDPLAPVEGRAEAILPLVVVKAFCSVVSDNFNDLLALLRDAAVAAVEMRTGKLLAETADLVWRGDFPSPCSRRLDLARGPLISVESIEGVDGNGDDISLAAEDYIIRLGGSWIAPATVWPAGWRAGSVVITFTAGFESPPTQLVQAALMLAAHWFANREAVVTGTIATELPLGVAMLCDQFRDVVI